MALTTDLLADLANVLYAFHFKRSSVPFIRERVFFIVSFLEERQNYLKLELRDKLKAPLKPLPAPHNRQVKECAYMERGDDYTIIFHS